MREKIQLSLEDRRKVKRAGVQFLLGFLQISGAIAGTYLLITTGASEATICVVLGTLLVSMCSRLMFSRKQHRRRDEQKLRTTFRVE